jgi:hypothetical protein
MDQDPKKDWRELCKKAASELDPAKLRDLIAELTEALDERDRKRKAPRESGDGRDSEAGLLPSAV